MGMVRRSTSLLLLLLALGHAAGLEWSPDTLPLSSYKVSPQDFGATHCLA